MDNAVDTTNESPIPTMALVRRSPFDQVRELAGYLNDLDTVATALCKATILPPTLQSPANLKLALLQGMSMGFDVVQTIRASFVITSKKGGARVGYYVEALVALVRSSPKCRFFRVEEATAKRCRVTCARTDEAESMIHTFELTWEQAVEANLNAEWDKNDAGAWVKSEKYTWKTAPADMLRNRNCGRAVKSVYQDVVFGMATPDELDDLNAAEAMEGSGRFAAAPAEPRVVRTQEFSQTTEVGEARQPDVVDAELVGSGDPAWDEVLELVAGLASMNTAGWIPVEFVEEWTRRCNATASKSELNALAPWIGEVAKRAQRSKNCSDVAARMREIFNSRNAEHKKAATGGAA